MITSGVMTRDGKEGQEFKQMREHVPVCDSLGCRPRGHARFEGV